MRVPILLATFLKVETVFACYFRYGRVGYRSKILNSKILANNYVKEQILSMLLCLFQSEDDYEEEQAPRDEL